TRNLNSLTIQTPIPHQDSPEIKNAHHNCKTNMVDSSTKTSYSVPQTPSQRTRKHIPYPKYIHPNRRTSSKSNETHLDNAATEPVFGGLTNKLAPPLADTPPNFATSLHKVTDEHTFITSEDELLAETPNNRHQLTSATTGYETTKIFRPTEPSKPTTSTDSPSSIGTDKLSFRTPKRKNLSPINPNNTKKRILNPMGPPSFKEVIQKSLWVVDVVNDAEEHEITKDQGNLIEEELTKALFASGKMGTLDFEHCGYDRGLYRTISRNTETRDWVISITPTLNFEKWPEAKLKPVQAGSPPKMIRASIVLAYPTPNYSEVFEIIDSRNPSVDTKFWRLYKKHKVEKGKQLWNIGIDENSAKAIKAKDYSVQYGLNQLKISIHDAKPNNKSKKTCILTTKDVELLLISQLSTGDLTVASLRLKINGCEKQILIASGYMPSERDFLPPSPEVIQLIQYCKTKNMPLILGCDAKTFKAGRSASFFTGDIRALRTATRKAFNAAKDRDVAKIALRREAQRAYSKNLRRSKRLKEQQLINSVNTAAGASNIIQRLKPHFTIL
ncbi:hypothetical protein Bhyg_07591, partial [Pseudolycoriella hygida]